jgi:hypothetical protein
VTRQLDLVARLPCRADHFTIQGDRLYAGARYGDGHAMTIVDVADATAPRVLATLACRGQVPSIAVAGEIAFVGEYCRSILAVDLRDPARPRPVDAFVSFRRELAHFQLQDGLLLAAAGIRGVAVFDVRDPRQLRPLPALAITRDGAGDEPDVTQLVARDGLIYAAVRHVGCVILEVTDGRLRERGRIATPGFHVATLAATAGCLWLSGRSQDDDEADLIVADRASGAIRARTQAGISWPKAVVDVPGGGFGLHTHYTGSLLLDDEHRVHSVLRQYEYDDDKAYCERRLEGDSEVDTDERDPECNRSCLESCDWLARHGDHLLAMHGGTELIVWRARPAATALGAPQVPNMGALGIAVSTTISSRNISVTR